MRSSMFVIKPSKVMRFRLWLANRLMLLAARLAILPIYELVPPCDCTWEITTSHNEVDGVVFVDATETLLANPND